MNLMEAYELLKAGKEVEHDDVEVFEFDRSKDLHIILQEKEWTCGKLVFYFPISLLENWREKTPDLVGWDEAFEAMQDNHDVKYHSLSDEHIVFMTAYGQFGSYEDNEERDDWHYYELTKRHFTDRRWEILEKE